MVRCAECASEWFQSPVAAGEPSAVAAALETALSAGAGSAKTQQAAPALSSISAEEDDAPKKRPKVFVDADDDPAPNPQKKIYFDAESEDEAAAIEAAVLSAEEGRAPEGVVVTAPGVVTVKPTAAPAATAADYAVPEGYDDEPPRGHGGAFLGGFATVAFIGLLAIAAYVKAPEIAAAAPEVEGPLTTYAAIVDQGREALAGLAASVQGML